MSQEQDFIFELHWLQPAFLLGRKLKVAESYCAHVHTIALRARPLRSFLGDPYKIPLTKAALCVSRGTPSSDVKEEKKKAHKTFFTHIHSCVYLLSYCQSVEDISTTKQHTPYGTLKMLPRKCFQSLLWILTMQKNVPFVMLVNEFSCSPFSLDLC